MAVNRIWFPNAPIPSISASDRAQLGVGYGGITIADGVWLQEGVLGGAWVQESNPTHTWLKEEN